MPPSEQEIIARWREQEVRRLLAEAAGELLRAYEAAAAVDQTRWSAAAKKLAAGLGPEDMATLRELAGYG